MAPFPPGKGGGEEIAYGRKGKGILIHSLTDGAGMPLSTRTTPANGDERAQVIPLLDALHVRTGKRGRPRKRLRVLAMDKGYDAKDGLPGATEQKHTFSRPVYWTLRSRVRPACMPEVLGVVPAIRWQPESVASCLTLFLRCAASWLLIGFGQAPPVPRTGVRALRRPFWLCGRVLTCHRI
jgi:DDE family transposase